MLETQKTQRWQEVCKRIDTMTDSVGCPVDDAIKPIVIALNALDVTTLASYEGHLDHGVVAPWIDIGCANVQPLAKLAHLKQNAVEDARARGASLEERGRLIEAARDARLTVKCLHAQKRRKIMEYLNLFYAQRATPCDQWLIINPIEWSGTGRLQSQGADLQECRPPEDQERYLLKYQAEMQAFAAFLKQVYFEEVRGY